MEDLLYNPGFDVFLEINRLTWEERKRQEEVFEEELREV